MKGNRLLENLNQELGSRIPMRRYSLADIISESYKMIYDCGEGSNLKKLAESHLSDVKSNPKDIERLSRQLSILKEMKNLTESGDLKDEDLVDKEAYDTVEPKEDRVIVQTECNESVSNDGGSRVYDLVQYCWDKGIEGDRALNLICRQLDKEGISYDKDAVESKMFTYFDEMAANDEEMEYYDDFDESKKMRESRSPRRSRRRRPIKESVSWRSGSQRVIDDLGMDGDELYYPSSMDIYDDYTPFITHERGQYVACEPPGGMRQKPFDSLEDAKRYLEDTCNLSESCRRRPIKDSAKIDESTLKESDDADLTDEELEELAKHLETIRKERKNAPKTEMTEADEPEAPVRRGIKCHIADSKKEELEEGYFLGPYDKDSTGPFYLIKSLSTLNYGHHIDVVPTHKLEDAINKISSNPDNKPYAYAEINNVEFTPIGESVTESRSYRGLENFKKQSESKAFYKTFKKMHESLVEGKALTRQESIDLYKASNSALTQLSIELEHNPEFLDTFKESVTVLSQDVTSLLESLTRGKAPSKKTMKSLAKFSEALLFESAADQVEQYIRDLASKNDMFLDDLTTPDIEDAAMNGADFDELGEMYAEIAVYNVLGSAGGNNYQEYENALSRAKKVIIELNDMYESKKVNEAENEEIPVEETPEEDFVGDDEGYVQSEEADAFDQEYADARVALHKELEDKHADDEDPEVQEKLAQDTSEVVNLPGTTEEQIAELSGEEESPEEPEDAEVPEESEGEIEEEPEEEEVDDSEITDDELAELKSHLKEMRAAKKGN